MSLIKINPLLYITDRDPVDEVAMDTHSWFKTETIVLSFGESIGKPSKYSVFRSSILTYLMANGWYIDAVLADGEGGGWQSVTSISAGTTGKSTASASNSTTSKAKSKSSAKSESASSSGASAGEGLNDKTKTNAWGASSGTSTAEGDSGADSSGVASSATETSQSNTSVSTAGGPPYWYAYQTLRLKRRKLQSELVLNDMINEFTKAYNEGRRINDERYDELVELYALMLSRTEDELNSISFDNDDLKPLIDKIMDMCTKSLEKFREVVDNIPDDWMQSRIDQINLRFDNELSQKKAELITQGLFNGTVWVTVSASINRAREMALNDLKDEMVVTKIDAYGKIPQITADIGGKILDAGSRLADLQSRMTEPIDLRNKVFESMLKFMERRDDEYPGLGDAVGIAERLGYGDGASMGA